MDLTALLASLFGVMGVYLAAGKLRSGLQRFLVTVAMGFLAMSVVFSLSYPRDPIVAAANSAFTETLYQTPSAVYGGMIVAIFAWVHLKPGCLLDICSKTRPATREINRGNTLFAADPLQACAFAVQDQANDASRPSAKTSAKKQDVDVDIRAPACTEFCQEVRETVDLDGATRRPSVSSGTAEAKSSASVRVSQNNPPKPRQQQQATVEVTRTFFEPQTKEWERVRLPHVEEDFRRMKITRQCNTEEIVVERDEKEKGPICAEATTHLKLNVPNKSVATGGGSDDRDASDDLGWATSPNITKVPQTDLSAEATAKSETTEYLKPMRANTEQGAIDDGTASVLELDGGVPKKQRRVDQTQPAAMAPQMWSTGDGPILRPGAETDNAEMETGPIYTCLGTAAPPPGPYPIIFCPCRDCQENTQRLHGFKYVFPSSADHAAPQQSGGYWDYPPPAPAFANEYFARPDCCTQLTSNPEYSQQAVDVINTQPLEYFQAPKKGKHRKHHHRHGQHHHRNAKKKHKHAKRPEAEGQNQQAIMQVNSDPLVWAGNSVVRFLGVQELLDSRWQSVLFNVSLLAGSAATSMLIKNAMGGGDSLSLAEGLDATLSSLGLGGGSFNPSMAGVLLASVYYGVGTLRRNCKRGQAAAFSFLDT